MKTPGEWSLLWANHELNGMSWADVVHAIRDEMYCGVGCIGDDCACCGDARSEWTNKPAYPDVPSTPGCHPQDCCGDQSAHRGDE